MEAAQWITAKEFGDAGDSQAVAVPPVVDLSNKSRSLHCSSSAVTSPASFTGSISALPSNGPNSSTTDRAGSTSLVTCPKFAYSGRSHPHQRSSGTRLIDSPSLANPNTGPESRPSLKVLRHGLRALGFIVAVTLIVVTLMLPSFCFKFDTHQACLSRISYLTLEISIGAIALMAYNMPADLVLICCTVILLLIGAIDDVEAWRGLSSPSVLTIGVLFILARALEETGAVKSIVTPLLGTPSGERSALLRLCVPAAMASAFLNNTPIVAMLIPACNDLATRVRLNRRVLLMPLSFASMLGGMCTLVGTSTNLVLNAQIIADEDPPCSPLTLFMMTPFAIVIATAGLLVLISVAPVFLSAKTSPMPAMARPPPLKTVAQLASTDGGNNSALHLAMDTMTSSRQFMQRALSIGGLVLALFLSALDYVPLLHSALAVAFVEVACGCLSLQQAISAVDFRVLLTIAGSFGLSAALENTHVSVMFGAALTYAEPFLGVVPFLMLLFMLTSLLSCVVSNAAAVVLVYSIVRDVKVKELHPSQIMLILMFAASSAFATPIGYQTNLMVQAAAGYRFGDFIRLGGLLTFVVGLTASIVVGYAPEAWLS